MMIFRPATPGFIVTLVATILLALVSFNTPIIKSIYFLEASLTVSNVQGTIKLGTLGYCLELSTNGTTCTDPKVGYKFDPNALLGNNTNIEIPSVVVKWITYALFLHIIALCASGVSALFGLLAHIREMSMTCCSTLISGLAAFVTLIAFIFDIVLFFIVKKRVEDINGSASFGGAVWMTLAAWILLFFSGCVFACGRFCIRRRPRNQDGRLDNSWMSKFTGGTPAESHAEQMRLDAVKAEQERKARQKDEVGLPAFPDRSEVLEPLKHAEELEDEHGPYRDHYNSTPGLAGAGAGGPRRQGSASTTSQGYRGGYAQAPPGTRAVDEYYSPTSPARSNSGAAHMGYPPNRQYSTSPGAYHSMSPGPAAVGAAALGGVAAGTGAAYLSTGGGGAGYGHTNTGTLYHNVASSQHDQYASTYSQYDPYSQTQSHVRQSSYDQPASGSAYAGAYAITTTGATAQQQPSSSSYANYGTGAGTGTAYGDPYGDPYASSQPNTNAYTTGGTAYQSPTTQQQNLQPERSYTLGGGGYGANVVPDVNVGMGTGAYGAPAVSTSPPPMPTATVSGALNSGAGPSAYGSKAEQAAGPSHGQGSGSSSYEDAPPGYEANPSVHVPTWGSKV